MKILVACEFSGAVREALRALGHDAWSSDLLPAEDGSAFHLQGDCLTFVREPWDALIAFPPCTFLANSGVRWLNAGANGERFGQMILAAEFFNNLLGDNLWSAARHIPRVIVENPIQHCYARQRIRKYDQIIHPWQHGHGETKATCIWRKGVGPIEPSQIVSGRTPRVHHASPGPERWKERSRTLPGIARALALAISSPEFSLS